MPRCQRRQPTRTTPRWRSARRGSLTGTTTTQLKTEKRNLQVVPLDGVEPTLANFESGAYRFTKKLYLIVPRNSSAEAQRFVDFLQSPQGVSALRETEALPDIE